MVARIADGHRLHCCPRINRGLEERRIEAAEDGAVGRRAFREDDDRIAVAERRRGGVLDAGRIAAASADDEQRIERRGDRAE